MSGGWPRLFLALFVACLSASIAYTIWPEREAVPPPGPHPRPAYWFWTPESLRNDAYLEQARDLARRGPFTLVFATLFIVLPVSEAVLMWGAARFACNAHPPESKKPRHATAGDIARTALFLIKDATYMSGQILTVDGGRSLNS